MSSEILKAKSFCHEHIKYLEQVQELIKKFMVNKEQFIYANSKCPCLLNTLKPISLLLIAINRTRE